MLVSGSLYAVNIARLWSLGDAGFEYVVPESGESTEEGAGLMFSLLKFNWMDTDTGIGISLTMTWYRQNEDALSWPIPPLELMWHPVSIKTSFGYLGWGIYDRAAWFANVSAIAEGRVTNSIGTRLIFSSHPFGKTSAPHRGTYHVNRALFFEYKMGDLVSFDPANNQFRMGITVDIGILAGSVLAGGAYLAAWPFSNTEQRKGRW
jgi:hypothetical protein